MRARVKALIKFQSTLPYGERPRHAGPAETKNCFNPRSRMGSDLFQRTLVYSFPVSIHAPVWGATNNGMGKSYRGVCFNPRSRMGSDPQDAQMAACLGRFQSTLPYGERQIDTKDIKQVAKFQSTLPYGERHLLSGREPEKRGFNPRSRMGSDSNHVQFFYHFP